MRYIKILFIIVCYFAYSSNVLADLCDKEHIKELKELANKVDVNYEYIEGGDLVNSYIININLLSDKLFVMHEYNTYYYNQEKNGLITFVVNSGNIKVTIHSDTCVGYKLRTISLNLPKFNIYSYKTECKELEKYDLDVCDPWYQSTINDNYFYSVVNKFLNKPEEKETFIDKIINFYNEYQLIIVGSISFVVLSIIGIILYRKRSVLE